MYMQHKAKQNSVLDNPTIPSETDRH